MPVSAEASPTMRIVPCLVSGNRFSFDIADISALAESALIHKDGGQGPVVGWIERRGQRVPVYTLAERLGMTAETMLGEVALILKHGREPMAVAVDSVSQPRDVDGSNIHPLPPVADPSLHNLIRSVLWHNSGLWLHMDAERLSDPGREWPSADQRPRVPSRVSRARSIQGAGAILAFAIPSINPGDRDLLFAVSARQVLEILEEATTIPIPSAPDHLRGLVAWRNRPVPLIDLGRILGWAPNPREKTAVLVVRGARLPETLALPIATGAGTFQLPFPHAASAESGPVVPDHVSSVIVDVGKTSVCVLDVDALLRPSSTLL